MRVASLIVFFAVGLMNFFPVVGVLSAGQLISLYGIDIGSPDLLILMRHRAVMLGLIGGMLIYAAFRPAARPLAGAIGLISMILFVVLAFADGTPGPDVYKVAVADIVGVLALAAVMVSAVFSENRSRPVED